VAAIEADALEVAHLGLGERERDGVVRHGGDRTDRDRDLVPAPEVAVLEHDMADLLVTLAKISDMPREERHTTPAGRALWIKYMAGCAMVETNFEAFAQNRAFEEFRSELKRLGAQVDNSGRQS